jgi:hypothetical protein
MSSSAALPDDFFDEDLPAGAAGNEPEPEAGPLLSALESAVLANQTARDAHPDDPPAFLDSELELFSALRALTTLPADPARFLAACSGANGRPEGPAG